MPLTEHQWEIRTPDGEVSLTFGTIDTGIQTRHSPNLGQRDIRIVDAPLPREDGEAFGPDFERGRTITFETDVLTDSHSQQSDLLDYLQNTWRDRRFRATSADYGVLRCHVAGRTRRCYGRPRRFAEVEADLLHEGWSGAIFDFRSFDGNFYNDTETVLPLSLNPTSSGGLQGPLTDPLTITNPGKRYGEVNISGQPTWATITITGPVLNPSIDLGDLTVSLDAELEVGQSVTIDPRPWRRTVTRNDGANLAGALTWDSPPMREMLLDPGIYLVSFTGTDPTGTATAEVKWRDAHSRP